MPRLRLLFLLALFPVMVAGAQLGLRAAGMEYCLTQLTMSVYYALVVMGLCLLMGYAGQVSLGHGAFFALGGYTTAVLTTHDFSGIRACAGVGVLERAGLLAAQQDLYGQAGLSVAPWAAFAAAMLLTFVVALLIGYPALRLRGHYLAMATLGFTLIVSKLLLGSALTGSADGIHGVPEWKLLPGLTVSGRSALRVQAHLKEHRSRATGGPCRHRVHHGRSCNRLLDAKRPDADRRRHADAVDLLDPPLPKAVRRQVGRLDLPAKDKQLP